MKKRLKSQYSAGFMFLLSVGDANIMAHCTRGVVDGAGEKHSPTHLTGSRVLPRVPGFWAYGRGRDRHKASYLSAAMFAAHGCSSMWMPW